MNDTEKSNFINNGYMEHDNIISKKKCRELLDTINKIKNYNKSNIFLNENEFLENPSLVKKNPGREINNILLDKSLNLDFIFKNEKIIEILIEILGKNYKIDLSKIVMGIPENWVPNWIKNELKIIGGSNNLNPFLKEKFRDVTCYYGAEYHQDSIDYSGSKALKSKTFLVMYVYFSRVTENDAPIYVLSTSHSYGAQKFPHNIDYQNDKIFYNTENNKKITLEETKLKGDVGTVFFWHSLLLHKTPSVKNSNPRISLKVVLEKKDNELGLIDEIDKKITNNLILDNPFKKKF